MAGYSYPNYYYRYTSCYYNGTGKIYLHFSAERTLLSYYGRAIFTIANKYIVTGTIRRDGSSNFIMELLIIFGVTSLQCLLHGKLMKKVS
jgi:hypothetical protein